METDVAALRSDQQRTWDEISKLRAAVHPMATSLTTLTMLTERAETDRGQMIAGLRELNTQLPPLIAVVHAQGARADSHIRECDRITEERIRTDSERHRENQEALDRIVHSVERVVRRVARVETIYAFIGAVVILVGFLASEFGRRLIHTLFPMMPS